jgi:hypothetical protein
VPLSNVETVRALYDAYRRKDIPAIFALLAHDAELYQSDLLPWGATYRGHEEIRTFFTRLTESIDSRVDVEKLVEAGEQVVAIGRSRGRVKKNEREFDVVAVHVWTIREGKVSRFEAYIDTPEMLRALTES